MPNTSLTERKIQKRVATRLGSSSVVVELENDDFQECIEQTLDVYNQRRPQHRHGIVPVTTQQKRYVLTGTFPPAGSNQTLAGVTDVQFITRRTQPSQVDPFDPFDTALAGVTLGSGSGETYGDIEQRLGYSEMAARVVDSEPEWHGVWEGSDYVLYLDIPRSHIQVGFTYTAYYDNTDAGRQLLPRGDVEWFLDYATAVGKTILGRVRGKFGGIANTEGGTDEVDASELLREGMEEMTRLREDLDRRRASLGPTSPE